MMQGGGVGESRIQDDGVCRREREPALVAEADIDGVHPMQQRLPRKVKHPNLQYKNNMKLVLKQERDAHIGRRRGRAAAEPPSPGTAGGPAERAGPRCCPHPVQNKEREGEKFAACNVECGRGRVGQVEQQPRCCPRSAYEHRKK